jgi:hypothetical protein
MAMMHRRRSGLAILTLFLGICFPIRATFSPTNTAALISTTLPESAAPLSGPFATPLTAALIDQKSAAEWVDGAERPLANPNALRQVVWTQNGPAQGAALTFGLSNQPGIRHLRLGFTLPIEIGSVLVRGGGRLSVLRAGAAYPGNLADDSEWLPAHRIAGRLESSEQVGSENYALWVLPPGTRPRALRFSYDAAPTDSKYAGTLGGVYLLPSRLANLAPEAAIAVSAGTANAPRLIDEQYNAWAAWDNGLEFSHPVTAAAPEWIVLTWPGPVTLHGLAALWAGFNAAEVQIFAGPQNINPLAAPEADWHSIGDTFTFTNQYPRPLGVDWLDFGKTVQTRAVRLRITAPTNESRHPHLVGHTRNGNRVWLGELMALSPLGASDLQSAALPAAASTVPQPPIPIRFNLATPGFVTLVIDDANGNRVRNLVSDRWFEAGANTVWWDGTDDLSRNPDAAEHGVYLIPTHFVAPGSYRVRGIVHQAIDLRYEFSIYNAGHPAWETADTRGGWLTNHTPPSAVLFLPPEKAPGGKPLVYIGSYVSEGGAGLAWVDLDGNKQGGRGWVGGNWTAAQVLARDTGAHANPEIYAYAGATWGDDKASGAALTRATIRVTGLTNRGDKPVLQYSFDLGADPKTQSIARPLWARQIGGLAVHDNVLAVSLAMQNQLLFADATDGRVMGTISVDHPAGLAFESRGSLLVLSGSRLLRFRMPASMAAFNPKQLAAPDEVIREGLKDPYGITQDDESQIYIGNRGDSNQVKVFSAEGKFLRAIGQAGPLQKGKYDPLHMNNPRGLAIDSNRHLWAAEEDLLPKRVSVWSLDGKLLKAFYGPSHYGGGGTLDPQDKTLYYYAGMELKLDWAAGTDALASILYRNSDDSLPLPRGGAPSSAVYANGHRYFTNAFSSFETHGVTIAMIYLDTAGTLRPVAALGRANDWSLLRGDAFRALWPAGADPANSQPRDSVLFTWSDLNGNGKVDADEVRFAPPPASSHSGQTAGAITVMPDMAMIDSDAAGKVMRFTPKFTAEGIPTYDLNTGKAVADGAQVQYSDGGGQVLYSQQATVMTTAPLPFSSQGIGGVDGQNHRWSYPSLWPGLHPSHSAPVPEQSGELIGTTRLLGGFVSPPGSEAGPLWAINGNLGDAYLFTADGFFVTQLFQDMRTGKLWNMPSAQRNMRLNDLSLGGENFFPSLTQTPDGKVYMVDGSRTSLVRIDGLETLRRIPPIPLAVTGSDLDKAQAWMKQSESARQQTAGAKSLEVTIRSGAAPALKDLIAQLETANWADVDHRIDQIGWFSKPNEVAAAVTIAGGRLFAAFRTNEPKLLINSGALANAPFKTGSALDLMIGADPTANPSREAPVAGDQRLLVYQVAGKTTALLYRAIVPGSAQRVPFSSPDRTVTFDEVGDVSNQVELWSSGGSYAFSIPLEALGLKAAAGERIKADIGILRGDGKQTLQRVYWSNKATGITSDVPSEAALTPNLWGEWVFKAAQ